MESQEQYRLLIRTIALRFVTSIQTNSLLSNELYLSGVSVALQRVREIRFYSLLKDFKGSTGKLLTTILLLFNPRFTNSITIRNNLDNN